MSSVPTVSSDLDWNERMPTPASNLSDHILDIENFINWDYNKLSLMTLLEVYIMILFVPMINPMYLFIPTQVIRRGTEIMYTPLISYTDKVKSVIRK